MGSPPILAGTANPPEADNLPAPADKGQRIGQWSHLFADNCKPTSDFMLKKSSKFFWRPKLRKPNRHRIPRDSVKTQQQHVTITTNKPTSSSDDNPINIPDEGLSGQGLCEDQVLHGNFPMEESVSQATTSIIPVELCSLEIPGTDPEGFKS
ncbi:hypothetical protein Dimus_011074, partial [Dionaea muscipula]